MSRRSNKKASSSAPPSQSAEESREEARPSTTPPAAPAAGDAPRRGASAAVSPRGEALSAAREVEGLDPALARLQSLARRTSTQVVVVAVALAFFVFSGVLSARTDTPTPDEFVYVPAGLYHLQTGDLSFDPTNPPLLKMVMALPLTGMDLKLDLDPRHRDNRTGWGPWIFGTRFMDLNRDRYLDAYFAARMMILALGVVLGLLVFVRARELLSPVAALATVVLYASMPPLIAHSALATLDLGVTVVLFAGFLATARFTATRKWEWAAGTGALFGLAFAVKGTAALLAPMVPVLVALGWKDWTRGGAIRFVGGGSVMAVAAWLAILMAYGFQGFPLPAPLVEGVRFQMAASSAGEFPAFLGGSWSQTGWWYYYFYTLALKTPLASLVLFAVGLLAVARRRALRRDMRHDSRGDDAWILLPALLLIYVLSFHYAKDYGVRYLLPAFPFLVLLAGRGVDLLLGLGARARLLAAVLVAWQLASCAVATPHQLAYFNELGGGPDHARRLLLDSNLDWGQDLGRLASYLEERGTDRVCLGYFGHVDPKVYGIDYTLAPASPAPGLCAVSANFLAGYPYAITYAGPRILGVPKGRWSWFDRLEPVARVGSSLYVFDVTAADVARLEGAGRP